MTSETTPTEAASSRPSAGEPSPTPATGLTQSTGLTRAQWRRLMAEAELAAKAADIPTDDVAKIDQAPEAPSAEIPVAATSATVDAAGTERDDEADAETDELVLTVVDGDAYAGSDLITPSRRRRAGSTIERPAAQGESFGPAAVDSSNAERADAGDADSAGASGAADESTQSSDTHDVDEFEFAARLFSFTAQTPVQVAEASIAEHQQRTREVTVARPGRLRRVGKRVAAASVSMSAVAAVGLLAVGLTSPAAAVFASGDTGRDITAEAPRTAASVEPEEIQAYVSSPTTGVTFDRSDTFDVTSVSEIAADSGVTNFAGTWVNDPNAAIQWPFPVGVPISAQFGSVSYLSEFSRPHRGVDLTPGAGAEIHAVAGGTVRIATEAGGDYGVTVVIDHNIDGELVSTRYGHMQYGSLKVKVGDTIEPGEIIGKVGSTGKSTGAHLHLEVLLGGTTQTDPIAWLEEHTKR
ncbi:MULTISPECIES: M23 family metallopeptidase [Microbacterium]|uniref:M23 family metallopeptidase n=1 Tax=Microbacterium TaxID=33882 RepID=UPI00217EF3B9|nr:MULTISPECIES: peptidoglycan DD-metalloendopeptidase family protein [Microbacterium]WJM16470.1 peptidoglycan DD-metalloendopeptidase family protein [Microbacterium arborescens]